VTDHAIICAMFFLHLCREDSKPLNRAICDPVLMNCPRLLYHSTNSRFFVHTKHRMSRICNLKLLGSWSLLKKNQRWLTGQPQQTFSRPLTTSLNMDWGLVFQLLPKDPGLIHVQVSLCMSIRNQLTGLRVILWLIRCSSGVGNMSSVLIDMSFFKGFVIACFSNRFGFYEMYIYIYVYIYIYGNFFPCRVLTVFDPCHRSWNDCKNAARYTGQYKTILDSCLVRVLATQAESS